MHRCPKIHITIVLQHQAFSQFIFNFPHHISGSCSCKIVITKRSVVQEPGTPEKRAKGSKIAFHLGEQGEQSCPF